MNLLTKKTVTELLKDTNRSLCVDDLEDIVALDKLADAISGKSTADRYLMNLPVMAGGVRLYPLTIAKAEFYRREVSGWPASDPNALLIWLLSLPLTSEALEGWTAGNAEKEARKLMRQIHCPENELADAVMWCMGADDAEQGEPSEEGTAAKYGGLIAMILREYRGDPDYWLYEAGIEFIAELADQYMLKVQAEQDAANHGKAVVTQKIRALKAYRLARNKLKDKWNGE